LGNGVDAGGRQAVLPVPCPAIVLLEVLGRIQGGRPARQQKLNQQRRNQQCGPHPSALPYVSDESFHRLITERLLDSELSFVRSGVFGQITATRSPNDALTFSKANRCSKSKSLLTDVTWMLINSSRGISANELVAAALESAAPALPAASNMRPASGTFFRHWLN